MSDTMSVTRLHTHGQRTDRRTDEVLQRVVCVGQVDSSSLGVDGALQGVLKQTHGERLGGLLHGEHRTRLPAEAARGAHLILIRETEREGGGEGRGCVTLSSGCVYLADLFDEAAEGQLAKQQVSRLHQAITSAHTHTHQQDRGEGEAATACVSERLSQCLTFWYLRISRRATVPGR